MGRKRPKWRVVLDCEDCGLIAWHVRAGTRDDAELQAARDHGTPPYHSHMSGPTVFARSSRLADR